MKRLPQPFRQNVQPGASRLNISCLGALVQLAFAGIQRAHRPTAMVRSGYTLTILRKEPDGRWVIFRDANLLAAGAAA